MEDTLEAWFTREVLPHEDSLTRFLSRRWRDEHELADLRQETYARVYAAAQKMRPRLPRAFLFATAKHLVLDRAKRRTVVSTYAADDHEYLDTLVDEVSPEQQLLANLELLEVSRALKRLSAKCREVLWMRRVLDLPQREVARRLGVSEKMIEKHLRIGAQRLAQWVRPQVEPAALG